MSITERAKYELDAINFGEEDTGVMIEILEKFFDQWDSGGAVWAVAPILQRLIAGKPLAPLTGKDDEWVIHDFDDDVYAQNKRCGEVFKRKNGTAYTIERGFREEIAFPYSPGEAVVASPVVEFEIPDPDLTPATTKP